MSRICLLGGTGYVGSAIAARLVARGHSVRILTRDPRRGQHLSVLPGVRLVQADVHDPNTLAREFHAIDVVVNLVGILNESGFSGQGFVKAHAELTRKVVEAAATHGVRKLVQMSSLGADERGPSHYQRSKGAAERHVRAAPAQLDWTILRPSVIFGPHDQLLNRFASILRLTQGWLPLARSHARFAPIWIGDVATAFERAVEDDATSRQSYDLGGPDIFTLAELVRFAGATIGIPAHVIPLPDAIARVQAFVMDFVPGRPFSTDNYRSLSVDNICRENGCRRLGIAPQSMRAIVPQYLGGSAKGSRFERFRTTAARAATARQDPLTRDVEPASGPQRGA
jgi:NADH dehydrogenase